MAKPCKCETVQPNGDSWQCIHGECRRKFVPMPAGYKYDDFDVENTKAVAERLESIMRGPLSSYPERPRVPDEDLVLEYRAVLAPNGPWYTVSGWLDIELPLPDHFFYRWRNDLTDDRTESVRGELPEKPLA